jgi:hypothetical protein
MGPEDPGTIPGESYITGVSPFRRRTAVRRPALRRRLSSQPAQVLSARPRPQYSPLSRRRMHRSRPLRGYRHDVRIDGAGDSADHRDAADLRATIDKLRAENALLQRLLDLRPGESCPPGASQTGIFESAPGAVHNKSPAEDKVASSGPCSPLAPTSTRSAGRTHAPASPAGCPPSVVGGTRAPIAATTCR